MATHIISETHRNALSIIFSSFPEDFLVSSYSSSFYLLQIFVNIDEGQQNLGHLAFRNREMASGIGLKADRQYEVFLYITPYNHFC